MSPFVTFLTGPSFSMVFRSAGDDGMSGGRFFLWIFITCDAGESDFTGFDKSSRLRILDATGARGIVEVAAYINISF